MGKSILLAIYLVLINLLNTSMHVSPELRPIHYYLLRPIFGSVKVYIIVTQM